MMNLSALILATGLWRATLMTPGGELPFQMAVDTVGGAYTLTVINGGERMLIDNVRISGDSLIADFPVYESRLQFRIVNKDEMEGQFVNLTRTTHAEIPVKAYSGGAPRFFVRSKEAPVNVNGRWSVMFSPGAKDSSYAIGIFKQDGYRVDATFLTSSGDYRYLEGVVDGDSLFLSAFDGVFVYLFKAKVRKSTLDGMFYSGTHRQVQWTGFRDEKAKLPDPSSITGYKNSDQPFKLRLPDTDSVYVSLDDERFRGKPVVVQILGSWCPNCLDESIYLQEYYERNQARGVEIVGLAFEKTDDFKRAAGNVVRFRNRLKISYPLLVASNRDKIKNVLPGLENFIAYPTTIYLDKQHKIRKIHAGFSGPATGIEYEKFKDDFELYLEMLILE
jgi:thiol-disulfide isomerase/thioredoxin